MMLRRPLLLLTALVLGLLGSLVSPTAARACACGAAPGAEVTGEQALITYDGTTEQVDLLLRIGRSTSHAGWIMPTPPSTQLALGTANFTALNDAVRPETRKRYDWTPRLPWVGDNDRGVGGVIPTSGVQVSTTEVGPFRVSTLTGSDASSVTRWLRDNGFEAADEQLPTFQRYLDDGWQIQAVALTPASSGTFTRNLPPLRMSFPTQQLVYPMELSRHAQSRQAVRLYVAAPFQVKPAREASSTTPLRTVFAGEVEPAVVGRSTGLGEATEGGSPRVYLTAFEADLEPATITGDYLFERTPDAPHRDITWVDDPTPGRVLGAVLVFGVPLAVAAGVLVWLLRRGRRQSA